MAEFKFGDEVRDTKRDMRGIVRGHRLMSMTSSVYHVVDESSRRWTAADTDLVRLAPAGQKGIGAVVAMVAAAQVRWVVEGCRIGTHNWIRDEIGTLRILSEQRAEWLRGCHQGYEFRVIPEGAQP